MQNYYFCTILQILMYTLNNYYVLKWGVRVRVVFYERNNKIFIINTMYKELFYLNYTYLLKQCKNYYLHQVTNILRFFYSFIYLQIKFAQLYLTI